MLWLSFNRDALMKAGAYDDPLFSLARQFAGAENFYGIKKVSLIKAVGLDIVGADVEEILSEVGR